MSLRDLNAEEWRTVCSVAESLLDAPAGSHETILSGACGADVRLRGALMDVVRNFSDSEDILGVAPLRKHSWLSDPRSGS